MVLKPMFYVIMLASTQLMLKNNAMLGPGEVSCMILPLAVELA